MATSDLIPGSILSNGFGIDQQKAINKFSDAVDAINATATTAQTNALITANNSLYISKAVLKSTTAAAVDFDAYKVAIAAL